MRHQINTGTYVGSVHAATIGDISDELLNWGVREYTFVCNDGWAEIYVHYDDERTARAAIRSRR